MYATIADHVKTAELFIKSGANLFAIDSAGRSALLWAAFYGHVDAVSYTHLTLPTIYSV